MISYFSEFEDDDEVAIVEKVSEGGSEEARGTDRGAPADCASFSYLVPSSKINSITW